METVLLDDVLAAGAEVYVGKDRVAIVWPRENEWWVGLGFDLSEVWDLLASSDGRAVEAGEVCMRPYLTEFEAHEEAQKETDQPTVQARRLCRSCAS